MKNFYQDLRMQNSVDIHLDITYKPEILPLHSHAFYEILFVRKGNIQYLLNDKRYQIQTGDIILIPPGMSHRPLFSDTLEEPYERFALWIDAQLLKDLQGKNPDLMFAFQQCYASKNYLLHTPSATWSALGAVFHSIYTESIQKKLGWDLCMVASMISLLAHLGRTYYYLEKAEPVTDKDNLFDEIFSYIVSHYSERFTVQEVADRFLVSQSTISHMFQKKMGISFYHCVTQRRLIAAKNMILSGQAIQSVWEPCGFPDYTAFYRAFRKEYGLSPREFLAESKR